MELLKPVKMTERKPLRNDKHFLQLSDGFKLAKNWVPNRGCFGRVANELVDVWYDSVKLPSPEDIQVLVGDHIPSHIRYEERQAMLRGARLAMEVLDRFIKRA